VLLSPGEPYSVVRPFVRERNRVVVTQEEPSDPQGHVWWGVECRFVRVRLSVPVVGSDRQRPLAVRALTPLHEVDDAPPFFRLGGDFLLHNRARVELEYAPWSGRLIIP
jgi:hypothetical protein